MNKKKVEEYLKTCQHGTFLLRFSDSELGSISIAWLRVNVVPTVLHIQPFNSRDLSARSLSDRLSDLEELKVRKFKNLTSENILNYLLLVSLSKQAKRTSI